MGYIVIFKRLAGIPNVAVLVLPMVQYNIVADMFWSVVQRDSGMSHLGTCLNQLLCTVLHQAL